MTHQIEPASDERIAGIIARDLGLSQDDEEALFARIEQDRRLLAERDAEIERLKSRLRAVSKKDRPKITPEERARIDAILHPNGRCTCAGEGRCDWCVKTEASIAAMTPDERDFMDHGPEPLFAKLNEARARAEEWHQEAVRLGREVAELREQLKGIK